MSRKKKRKKKGKKKRKNCVDSRSGKDSILNRRSIVRHLDRNETIIQRIDLHRPPLKHAGRVILEGIVRAEGGGGGEDREKRARCGDTRLRRSTVRKRDQGDARDTPRRGAMDSCRKIRHQRLMRYPFVARQHRSSPARKEYLSLL